MRLAFALILMAMFPAATAFAQNDTSVQVGVDKVLHEQSLKNIHGSVQQGTVTLRGAVVLYSAKLRADVKVSRIRGVSAINDEVRVAGAAVADGTLEGRLRNLIAYNTYQRARELPVGAETISVEVRNGVVTLISHNADPLFASVALVTAENTPGVKGVVNRMQTKGGAVAICSCKGLMKSQMPGFALPG